MRQRRNSTIISIVPARSNARRYNRGMDHPDDARLSPGRRPPALSGLRQILPAVIPAALVGVGYLAFLGYRHDYLGHYAAGYGATLAALAVATKEIPDQRFLQQAPGRILWLTLACILAGAFAEATAFNIAKFDEVDFCNQSVGAALAGLGFLASIGAIKADPGFFRAAFYAGIVALHAGFYFAMF